MGGSLQPPLSPPLRFSSKKRRLKDSSPHPLASTKCRLLKKRQVESVCETERQRDRLQGRNSVSYGMRSPMGEVSGRAWHWIWGRNDTG